jgi:hypothetical protein
MMISNRQQGPAAKWGPDKTKFELIGLSKLVRSKIDPTVSAWSSHITSIFTEGKIQVKEKLRAEVEKSEAMKIRAEGEKSETMKIRAEGSIFPRMKNPKPWKSESRINPTKGLSKPMINSEPRLKNPKPWKSEPRVQFSRGWNPSQGSNPTQG